MRKLPSTSKKNFKLLNFPIIRFTHTRTHTHIYQNLHIIWLNYLNSSIYNYASSNCILLLSYDCLIYQIVMYCLPSSSMKGLLLGFLCPNKFPKNSNIGYYLQFTYGCHFGNAPVHSTIQQLGQYSTKFPLSIVLATRLATYGFLKEDLIKIIKLAFLKFRMSILNNS